ncbi:MAG: hypothetical protein ACLU3I_15775 [Acutalibacteraceae bacterium]
MQQVYDRGFRTFLCGMARGCDQYFAEAVLACRAAGTAPEAILTAMVPCPSQKDGWPAEEQSRATDALLAACSAGRGARADLLQSRLHAPAATAPWCKARSLLISVSDGTPAAPRNAALPKSWGSRCCRCGCERLGGRIFRRICGQRCILQCRNSS